MKKKRFKAWSEEDHKKFLEFLESEEYKNFVIKLKIYKILKEVVSKKTNEDKR